MKIIKLESVSSTNDYCKSLKEKKEDVIVIAKKQTGGRGTKGRAFSSPEGGIYLSTLNFFENFPAERSHEILIDKCMAVVKTLEHFGIKAEIKWSNDVFVGGKKICGTLIENTLSGKNISCSVCGMGINVNTVFDGELKEIATSMAICKGRKLDISEVESVFLKNLEKHYSIEEYRSHLVGIGKSARFLFYDGREEVGQVSGVTDDLRLIVEIDGKRQILSSVEVSLRWI